MQHIIFFSGGAASYLTAKRVVKKNGAKNCLLVFADTGIEDTNTYEFIKLASKKLSVNLIRLKPFNKDPWDIYMEKKFLNHRVSFCSQELKIKPCRNYVEQTFTPSDCTLYLGIDFNEIERGEAIAKHWNPYIVQFPLCENKWATREDYFREIRKDGLKIPPLYGLGFSHNNCGGFCVKAGKKQFAKLLKYFPDRYAYHENREQEFMKSVGKKTGVIIRDYRANAPDSTISLKEFREEIEAEQKKKGYLEPSLFSDEAMGGCGCFTTATAKQ